MNTFIINYLTSEKRYALLNNGVVEKLVVNQPKKHSSVGNIYLGIVEKVLPGMNAAFVDIGEGKSGYLHRDKLASFIADDAERAVKGSKSVSSYVHQGEKLLVQVEKDTTGTKGPRLTGVIEVQGNHLIYMPKGRYIAISKKIEENHLREDWRQFGNQIKKAEEGLIFRTSCKSQIQADLIAELEELREEYKEILTKAGFLKKPGKVLERNSFLEEIKEVIGKMETGEIIVDDPNFKAVLQKNSRLPVTLYSGKGNIFSAYHIENEIEKALKRIVWLENGAYLVIDEAEALTVIDVNTGKYAGKNDLRETVLKTNEWASKEAAKQIRLRDIGGIILIDFIDMKNEQDRNRILAKMEAELKRDDRRTNLIGFTSLGILQLTRKKTKPAISEALMVQCPVCAGTGRILSPETVAFRLERELWEHRGSDYEAVIIFATDNVQGVFSGERNIHKQRMEESIGLEIIFSPLQAEIPSYEIRQFGKADELRRKQY